MSYQVLARKWRPGNFTEMVGQEHVLRALINALDNWVIHCRSTMGVSFGFRVLRFGGTDEP